MLAAGLDGADRVGALAERRWDRRPVLAIALCGLASLVPFAFGIPYMAMVLAALGITTLSMPASSLLRLKAAFASVQLAELRAVLAAARRNAAGQASLRAPLLSWAREHGHLV